MKSTSLATPASSKASRPEFDSRLNSYSKAALSVAAVSAIGVSRATAQTVVHNITAISGTYAASVIDGLGARGDFSVAIGSGAASFHFFANGPGFPTMRLNGGDGLLLNASEVRNLVLGEAVNGAPSQFGARFGSGGPVLVYHTYTYGVPTGEFRVGGVSPTGYIGFKKAVGSHLYYGWLCVSLTFGGSRDFELNGFQFIPKDGTTDVYGAYAIGGINAGQSAPAAVPEPAQVATGLGLLALGAAGVREFRRRRKLEAA